MNELIAKSVNVDRETSSSQFIGWRGLQEDFLSIKKNLDLREVYGIIKESCLLGLKVDEFALTESR